MKDIKINIGVGMNMQEYYDNLVLLHRSIGAQIAELGKDVSICTHKETEEVNGITFCKSCRKPMSANGLHDWVRVDF